MTDTGMVFDCVGGAIYPVSSEGIKDIGSQLEAAGCGVSWSGDAISRLLS